MWNNIKCVKDLYSIMGVFFPKIFFFFHFSSNNNTTLKRTATKVSDNTARLTSAGRFRSTFTL